MDNNAPSTNQSRAENNLQLIMGKQESWTREIEQVMLTALNADFRVIGISSSNIGAGVSLTTRLLAASFARSMRKTLLIDLSKTVEEDGREGWAPGKSSAADFIATDINGFDYLDAAPSRNTRSRFNHAEELRRSFAGELGDYEIIILDLPSPLDGTGDQINAVATAVACDAVMIVCSAGVTTRPQLRKTIELFETAGASVFATLVNNHKNIAFENIPAWLAKIISRLSGLSLHQIGVR